MVESLEFLDSIEVFDRTGFDDAVGPRNVSFGKEDQQIKNRN